ncbi:ABC transporter [Xylariales sp. PMI_506]|nr:ABC transporter [Xylariales sp. PMI_506]
MASNCSLGGDNLFGPQVDALCRAFDFTLLFEDIVLTCLPAAAFLALVPAHITVLSRNPPTCSIASKLLFSKLSILSAIFITQIIFLAFRVQDVAYRTDASLTADVLSLTATGAALWLSFLGHQRSMRPSTLLSLYLSAVLLIGVARVRTLWLMGYRVREPATLTATFTLTLAALVLESWERRRSLKSEKQSGALEEYSGIWVRTSFTWLLATFHAGYSKILHPEDLPKLDTNLEAHKLHKKLTDTWALYDRKERHSLLKACFRAYLRSFLSGAVPRLFKTLFSFLQPFLINATVTYVGQANPDPNYGKGLIGAWALVFLGVAVSTAIHQYQLIRFITRMRGGLIGLVYQETMNARTVDVEEITAVALMGTDVERIGQSFMAIHESWGSVIEIAIAIWLLEEQVSIACLAPVAIVLIFVATTYKLSDATKTAQRKWIERVEQRLRVTASMLEDMKAIKMLGLSKVMIKIVQGMRKKEIESSGTFRILLVWQILLSNSPINLAPVATFAVYVIISVYWKNQSLFAAQAFTSVALISLLTTPVLIFIQTMPSLLQCVGSFDRIQEFCNYRADAERAAAAQVPTEGSNNSSISLESLSSGNTPDYNRDSEKHIIALEKQEFSWGKDKPAFLRDIALRIQQGSITMVVGPVGSGKTTLLESILGETISTAQQSTTNARSGAVAYCAQQPWLENGTIRSNIIGVSPFDRVWYKAVRYYCALDEDFKQWDKRDMTLVGSKGLNLSGGQKQRIALARAIYSHKTIVLLDDVFSGMDTHTVESISQRLLSKDGYFRKNNTTVILATHSHKLMGMADSILVLANGRIIEAGAPQTLMANDGYVATLGLKLSDDELEAEPKEQDGLSQTISRIETAIEESMAAQVADLKEEDDLTRKSGNFGVYKYYFDSAGLMLVILFVACIATWIFCSEFPTVWLDWWSAANAEEPNKNVGMYMGVYAAINIFGLIFACVGCWVAFINIISNSGYKLHNDLLVSVLGAPFRFFTTTDTGNLTNRFSQDMELIDMNLPSYMVNYVATLVDCFIKSIIIVIFSKYLATTIPFVLAILYFIQRFYLQTSRQVRLLEIEAKAPLFTHFIESVAGAGTIRAFGWQPAYQQRNYGFIDSSQKPAYLQHCIQGWLGFVLDMLVTVLAVILVGIVITWKDKFSAGSVGVSLVMVMTFGVTLMRLIKMWTMMESSIGAVNRVKRFSEDTEREEEEGANHRAPASWPTAGLVEFKGLVAAHRPDSDPVIKGVSLTVKPEQHIAICGRSGSGKTSLILALLKMIDTQGGQITIDGIELSDLQCNEIRSNVNVVPQDPFLMPGTVRFNMDPFGAASDADITSALEKVKLWNVVHEQGGLDKEMDTAAWSSGQKQLLCLARAMVRQSKVLILDEAASSVDSETEAVMQEIIDTVFKKCTVLAVMHRLKHIQQYDKVALLDAGRLMEFDAPSTLLARESRFKDLYEAS